MISNLRRVSFVVIVLTAAIGFYLARHPTPPRPAPTQPAPPGRWNQDRTQGIALPDESRDNDDGRTEEQRARLGALPYLAGTHAAPVHDGVVVHDRKLTFPGANFVVSGDSPGATLIDMDGKVLHRWALSPESLWPEYDTASMKRRARYWRRARLMDDGGVIALFEGAGLARLDVDSKPIWSRAGEYHHDFDLDDDGNIHVLERRQASETTDGRYPLLLDYIVTLNRDGDLIGEISIEECFEHSEYAGMIHSLEREGDIFHTNSISWLNGGGARHSPLFQRGNLLISQRNTDVVAIIDPSARKVVWARDTPWKKQHDPVLLESGSILMFDNLGIPSGSRILAFDPLTDVMSLIYIGDETHPFFSATCGANQRLANGNTLITESDFGRAFEITPDGTIVWEYLNPRRAGANNELIATLFEVTRLDLSRLPFRD